MMLDERYGKGTNETDLAGTASCNTKFDRCFRGGLQRVNFRGGKLMSGLMCRPDRNRGHGDFLVRKGTILRFVRAIPPLINSLFIER